MYGKTHHNKTRQPVILWWIAIISISLSLAIYYAFKQQASVDVDVNQQRLFIPFVGFVIAGICLIAGTSHRWFKR